MERKNKKGFSLLELTLVLGVGSLMAFIKFQDMKSEQELLKASAAGQQIKQLGEAVNGYINVRYDKLSTLVNAAGTGTDPGPRTCSTATAVCTITYQTLINEGLLPSSYVARNSYGSDYAIQLKRTGNNPNYIIDGIIITNTPWIDGGKIRYDLLGKAMQSAGIDSGMTKLATQLDGYNGSWRYLSSTYSTINKTGALGYRVGYNSSMYSVYLRRDGTLPMTGNLNMGKQSIYNIQNITAAGAITGQSLKTTGDVNIGGKLTVAGTTTLGGAVQINNTLKTTGAINSSGNISGVNITGTSLTGNTITSKGETYTQNWFRALGDGGLYFQKYGGGWNMTNSTTIQAYGGKNIATTGAISASGNITGNVITGNTLTSNGQMISKGRLTAGEFLQLNKIATENTACSPNGLQGRNNIGKLLSCVSGRWNAVGSVKTSSYASGVTNLGVHAYCAITRIGNAEDGHYCQISGSAGNNWTKSEHKTGCIATCFDI